MREVEQGFDTVGSLIEAARFRSALQETMRLAGLGNQYVAEQAPWAKLEAERERAGTILYVAFASSTASRCCSRRSCRSRRSGSTSCSATTTASRARSSSRTVEEDGDEHVVLTGDYETLGRALGAERAARRAEAS